MLKRPIVILAALILMVLGGYIYLTNRIPEGVTPQSGSAETLALIGLSTSVVGLLTAIVGLIGKIVEARKA